MTVPACDQSTSGSFHTETLGSSPRSRKASGRARSSASRSGSSAHVAKVTIGSDTQPTLPDGDCADHAQAQVDQIRARVKSARIRPNPIRGIQNACPRAPKGCDASGANRIASRTSSHPTSSRKTKSPAALRPRNPVGTPPRDQREQTGNVTRTAG